MKQREERQQKRLLDGRQKEKRQKIKSKPTHMNAIIQDYFNSILITNHAKRQRHIIEIEHN